MIEYILSNKEWIFSGIGIFILTLFLSLARRQKKSLNKAKIKGSSNKVSQASSKAENDLELDGDMNNINQS